VSRAKDDISESDLLRFVEGDCSPDEAAAVQAWIVADPRRGELLDELRAVWRLTGSTTRSWAVAETRFRLLRTRGRHAVQRSAGLPRRSWAGVWALRFAAAVATLVAGVAVWRHHPRTRPPREYVTAAGQRLRITLTDSTRVVLSVGTRLRVPADYGVRERAVELEGEAYFVVRHDPHHLFLVRTRHGVTEDLGTSFDVRAYAHEPFVQVVVAAGRVALRGDSVVTLRARDRGIIDARGVVTATSGVSLDDYLAWTRGTLVFSDAPLPDVVAQLARWYAVDIVLDDPHLADARVTIALANRSVDAALAALAKVLDARVTRSGDVVRLTAARRGP
jgi:transmembrane sensor